MPVWRVDIFGNRDDIAPSRRGLVKVNSEDAAVAFVSKQMGDAQRADLIRTVVSSESNIRYGYTELAASI